MQIGLRHFPADTGDRAGQPTSMTVVPEHRLSEGCVNADVGVAPEESRTLASPAVYPANRTTVSAFRRTRRRHHRPVKGQDDPTLSGNGVDSVSRGVIPRFWPRFRCPAPSLRRPEGRITRDGRGRRNASPPGGAGMCFRWKKRGGGAIRRVPVAGGGPPGSRPREWAAGGAWLR